MRLAWRGQWTVASISAPPPLYCAVNVARKRNKTWERHCRMHDCPNCEGSFWKPRCQGSGANASRAKDWLCFAPRMTPRTKGRCLAHQSKEAADARRIYRAGECRKDHAAELLLQHFQILARLPVQALSPGAGLLWRSEWLPQARPGANPARHTVCCARENPESGAAEPRQDRARRARIHAVRHLRVAGGGAYSAACISPASSMKPPAWRRHIAA